MQLALEHKDIKKFLMVGDKILIKPKNPQSQTKSGLYLPPSVQDKDKIQSGYVIKVGPGYPCLLKTKSAKCGSQKKKRFATYLCKLKKETWLFICKMQPMELALMMKNI